MNHAAPDKDVSYYGYEPNQKTYDGLYECAEFFGFDDKINIKKCGSEEKTFGKNVIDFAFSSPPYFTAEIYSTDENDKQCYNTYPDYDEWMEKYWAPQDIVNEYIEIYKELIPKK